MSEADLTQIKAMLQAEARATKELRASKAYQDKLTRARDQLRDQIARLMGSHDVGIVDGTSVLKRTVSQQFAKARFREENPDLYDAVKTYEMTEVIDVDKLKEMAPNVYQEYLTVRWTNTIEVD